MELDRYEVRRAIDLQGRDRQPEAMACAGIPLEFSVNLPDISMALSMEYVSFALVVILLVFIVLSIGRPKNSTSADEVATVIENFLDGTSGEWDWDEFIDSPIADPELDAIRLRCATLPREFPPSPGDGYVNSEGDAILRHLVTMLRERG